MEKGPLAQAVEPATRAAEELRAAADHLGQLWKSILARLRQYTQDIAPIFGTHGGIPHGMSPETMERIKRLVFMLLRATGALTRAIERQTDLMEKTDAAHADADLPPLKPDQDALPPFIITEVIPFNVKPEELPAHMADGQSKATAPLATEFLQDAIDRMQRSSTALENGNRTDALKRQEQAIELMSDALAIMVKLLQRLLGQFAPPGLSGTNSGGAMGMALIPDAAAGKAAGYQFRLTSDQQESVRQAFRGTFPERYERPIKLYYQTLARQESLP